MSEFGEGFGPQPNQFECPDFIQLPVDGDRSKMKWVMIVNINPGFVYGGSGTMYFVGDFDGHRFVRNLCLFLLIFGETRGGEVARLGKRSLCHRLLLKYRQPYRCCSLDEQLAIC